MICNENAKINGKRLMAALAVFVVVACCFAILAPSSASAEPYGTYNSTYTDVDNVTFDETSDELQVSFIDEEGTEYTWPNASNQYYITNTIIGNYGLNVTKDASDNFHITGNLMRIGDVSELKERTDLTVAQKGFVDSGAPAGYDYGIIYRMGDFDGKYLSYENSAGTWISEQRNNGSKMLQYINEENATGSATYYISENKIESEDDLDGANATSFTVSWNLNLVDNQLDNGVSVIVPAGMTVTASGSNNVYNINVSGSAVAPSQDDRIDTASTFGGIFGTVADGYNYIMLQGVTNDVAYSINQVNSALEIYEGAQYISQNSNGEWIKTGPVKDADHVTDYTFLIPKNGGVTVTVVSNGNTIATYNFIFNTESISVVDDATAENVSTAFETNDTVVVNGVTEGATLDVPENKTLTVQLDTATDFSISTTVDGVAQKATFEGISGTITYTQGSIQIYGKDIEAVNGKVTIENNTTVRILDGTEISGTIEFLAADSANPENVVVEVTRSATVDFTDAKVTFTNVDVNIKGTVTDGTITAGPGSVITVDGTVTSDFVNNGGTIVNNSATQGTITLSDGTIIDNRTSVDGSISQDIIVTGDVTVVAGGSITINGTMTVENGATITFEQGSKFIVGATGKVVIDGTVNIEAESDNASTIFSYSGSSMAVNGTLNLEGMNAFATDNGKGVTVSGAVNVGEDATAAFEDIVVLAGGNLNVYGIMTGSVINNGTVTVDSEATPTENVTVYMRDGATLDLVNAVGTYVVTDAGMTFRYNGVDNPIETVNTLTFTNVSGATVTETLTTENKKDPEDATKTIRVGYGNMYVSGDADVASNTDDTITAGKIDVTAGKVQVAADDTMSVTAQVGLSVAANATFAVAGDVDVTDKENSISGSGTIANGGTIDVTGKITTKDEISTGTINAAHYESGTGSAKVHVYTTLATAIADGADDIELLGKIVISEDVTIPARVKVDASTATSVVIEDTATVTVAYDGSNSGKLTNGSTVIDVDGTLIAEHLKKSGLNEANIDSDVASYNGDSAKYTSIYKALAEAQDGDVVEVTRDGPLTIEKDITIPTGVTLLVPESAVTVAEGVTVTVNGTYEGDNTYVMNPSEDPNDPTQTIVNGMFKLLGTTDGLTSTVSGAYYAYDGYNVISPLSVLSTVIADVESDDAKVYGTVTEGDVSIASEDFTIAVQDKAVLTLSSLALSGVTFDFTKGWTNATVSVADGSFQLVNAVGGTISAVTVIENDVETTTATLSGDIKVANEGKDTNGKDITGSVTVGGTADIVGTTNGIEVPVTISEGAVVGTSADFSGKVTVNGTLNVEATGVEFKDVVVSGTIAVAEDADASVTGVLYVGVTKDDKSKVVTDLGSGSVTGVTVNVAYVSPNATFTATEAQADDLASTEYYVEGDLLVIAFAENDNETPISNIGASVPDAYYSGWVNADGKPVESTNIGGTDFEQVYADIVYDVYVINLRADQNAVSSVYIDGNIMQFGMINEGNGYYYGYTAVVSAGSHKIDYQLANGYSGNGILTVDGTQMSGMTFTTEGQPTESVNGSSVLYKTYNLQLSGFEKSGYVPDSPDTPTDTGDDGMSITDILLIVLVVLIIIMAIIVAVRLMRS